MSKWYEVEITASKVMAVEMPDEATEDEAYEFAVSESGMSGAGVIEGRAVEITGAENIATIRRHADQVEPL
jgi:hypothetical protein